MSDAPKTIWAMQFDEPVSANSQGVWGTVNGLERTPRKEYTLTSSVSEQLKAADELAAGVFAWGHNEIGTDEILRLVAAYRATKEIPD